MLELWQLKESPVVRKSLKIIILAICLFFIARFGFALFNVFRDSVLSVYNINWKISITREIQIDFYGAVVPTVFSLLIIFYLVYFKKKFSIKYYFAYFLLSIAFALGVTKVTPGALISLYELLALLVSFLGVSAVFCDIGSIKFLKLRYFNGFNFTKRNYFIALLVAYSYASLSTLVADLAYLPFAISSYIGAKGLTDGIMLSGLFTPLSTAFATLSVMIVYELGKLTGRRIQR